MDQQSIIADRRYIRIVLVLMLLAALGSIGILAWVPPVSRDALTHHLAVPKLYLQHGEIYEIPSIVYSYYPMNLDLLYLIPLYFGNDIAPKYIHFLFALLTAGLIFAFLAKRIGAEWGLFGALFFLSLPIIVKLSITVYVDLGLVFFSTAALINLIEWIENRFRIKFIIFSAVFCGLALGTKYNGLVLLFILTLFIPFIFISHFKKHSHTKDSPNKATLSKIQLRAVGFGAAFITIALLVFSPWMIRNYIWQANPIYPLYDNVFNRQIKAPEDTQSGNRTSGSAVDPQNQSKTKSTPWSTFAVRKVIYGESWWEIVLIPVRIFFQGQDDNPKYFDGQLNPFLFFLPFFAFVHLKKNPASLRTEKKILIFFALFFILYTYSTTVIRIRYVAPVIPGLVILAVLGLNEITRIIGQRQGAQPAWYRTGSILLLVAIMLGWNAAYILKQFHHVDPFSYISGRMSRDTYIAKYRPEYSIYQYANRHLADNVKILGLFLGNRRYYSDREIIFSVDMLKQFIERVDSDRALLKELGDRGFSYLIIRFDLFNSWSNKQFDDEKKQILKKFFAEHTINILSKDGYGLFELR